MFVANRKSQKYEHRKLVQKDGYVELKLFGNYLRNAVSPRERLSIIIVSLSAM